MKRLFLSLSTTICLLASYMSSAQMLGDCVFLKGKYVEVGVAPNGGYGSTRPAPAGYHPFLNTTTFTFYDPALATTTTSGNFLGFVADYGRDGWTTGTPNFWGDFYLPGTPQEGWAIRVGATETEAYIPSFLTFGTTGYSTSVPAMTGTNISYVNAGGGVSKGIWKGTRGALDIRQTTILDTNKLYFTVNVVLTNTGTTPLNNIYYLRTVDPDNEQTRSGDFTTSNVVNYQVPNPGNKVLVSATGTGAYPQNAYLGLGTKDCRAKAVIYDFGLDPGGVNLQSIYDQTNTFRYDVGIPYVNDVGIGLVYNIGTIAAGDSTSLTYAYILNASYIDSALDATQPPFLVNTLSFNSGDSINMCTYNFDTVLVSLGNAAFYHWHWSPSTYLTDTAGWYNVIQADSLSSTMTYTITGVNISGGCDTVRYLLTFTHDPFTISLGNRDTTICYGESVSALVTGSPLLDYVWTPSAGVSDTSIMNPVITPSVSAIYSVTASSSSGCLAQTRSFSITVRQPPSVTVDSTLVKTCVSNPVLLHSSATPTGVSYSYSWSPATNLSNNTIANPTVTPTAPGDIIYTVTASPSDIPRCKGTASLTVHTLGDFTINTPNANICLGSSVTLNVTPVSDTELRYVWTPATGVATSTSMAPVITPPAQGFYTYTVTGSYANCPDYVHTYSIRVDTPATPINIIDTICLGMSANVDLTVPGGNSTTNYYHYQWTPSIGVSNDTMPNVTITPPNLGTNTYILTTTPPAGCAVNNVVTIEVLPNAISVRPTDTTICEGQIVQVIGSGHPAFSYQWLPTAGIASPNILNALITPDTTTFYTVVASFHGCPDMPATLNLHVEPNPTVYVGGNRPMCQFDTLHIHAAVAPAWFSGYTYSWTPAAGLDNTTSANVVFSGSASTNVVVTVSTSAGCTAKDSAYITFLPGNFASIDASSDFCPGESKVINVSPATGLIYHWSPSIFVSDSTSASPTVSPIASQTYTVIAATASGCKDTVYWTATVHPAALISIPDSVLLYAGESYHIEPITNGTGFVWFPPEGLSNPYISDPVASPDLSTRYIVTATTEEGCQALDTIYVIRTDDAMLAIPNAFTPGTGANNTFKILNKGISQLNYFRVYNRWGNIVFETRNINEGWDGSWKGEPQPFGVYIYDIQAVSLTGKLINKGGNVTLIR